MNLRRYRRGEATATLPIVFEDVDWAELAEAYYGDPDMQELFAALASDDENDIVVAEEELASSIMVCSEVFESTAAAVPLSLTWFRPLVIVGRPGCGWSECALTQRRLLVSGCRWFRQR